MVWGALAQAFFLGGLGLGIVMWLVGIRKPVAVGRDFGTAHRLNAWIIGLPARGDPMAAWLLFAFFLVGLFGVVLGTVRG